MPVILLISHNVYNDTVAEGQKGKMQGQLTEGVILGEPKGVLPMISLNFS